MFRLNSDENILINAKSDLDRIIELLKNGYIINFATKYSFVEIIYNSKNLKNETFFKRETYLDDLKSIKLLYTKENIKRFLWHYRKYFNHTQVIKKY